MAFTADEVVVELEARTGRYNTNIIQSKNLFVDSMNVTINQAKRMERSVASSFKGAGLSSLGLGRILAGLSVITLTKEVLNYADAWIQVKNRITAAGGTAEGAASTLQEIYDIAIRSRTALDAVALGYQRIASSSKELGLSQKEVLTLTETVSKALQVGGASASEAHSIITQLTQALGSGVLQGDELRSLRENSIVLTAAIAKEFNTTIGGLKKLGEQGGLSSARVAKAILNANAQIEASYKTLTPTIEGTFENVKTAFERYIGEADAAHGATARLKEALQALADNFEKVADPTLKLASIIAAALLGRAIGGMIAAVPTAIASILALAAAFRTGASAAAIFSGALGPIGLLLGGVAAAIYVYDKAQVSAKDITESHALSIKGFADALAVASDASADFRSELRKNIEARLASAKAARDAALAQVETSRNTAIRMEDKGKFLFAIARQARDNAIENMETAKETAKAAEATAKAYQDQLTALDKIDKTAPPDKKPPPPITTTLAHKETPAEKATKDLQAIKDRTAALENEAAQLGKTRFEQERSAAALELSQELTKDGIIDITAYNDRINASAIAYANATVNLEKMHERMQDLQEIEQFLGSQMEDTFDTIVEGSFSAEQSLQSLAKALAKAAFQAAILGQGPLASLFGTKGESGDIGGIIGSLGSLFSKGGGGGKVSLPSFGGPHDHEGHAAAGKAYEIGKPEKFVPTSSGIIPQKNRGNLLDDKESGNDLNKNVGRTIVGETYKIGKREIFVPKMSGVITPDLNVKGTLLGGDKSSRINSLDDEDKIDNNTGRKNKKRKVYAPNDFSVVAPNLQAIWGGRHDHPGHAAAGRAYEIGKREIFMPTTSGIITPNMGAAGGGGSDVRIYDQRGANAPPIEQQKVRGPTGKELVKFYVREEIDNLSRSPAGRSVGIRRGTRGVSV